MFYLLVDDFRIFVGDLGNDVNDDTLARSFARYSSFLKARSLGTSTPRRQRDMVLLVSRILRI